MFRRSRIHVVLCGLAAAALLVLAVSEADHALAEERQKKAGGEIQEVESVPMTSQVISANAISVQVSPELEAEAKTGAQAGTGSPDRLTQWNGYRERSSAALSTGVAGRANRLGHHKAAEGLLSALIPGAGRCQLC